MSTEQTAAAGNQEPTPHPPWRYALQVLEQRGIAPGGVIEKGELEQLFGLTDARTMGDFQKNTQLFRFYVWQLRQELLHRHRLVIRALAGVGYEVLQPQHQTHRVMRDRGEAISRELTKLAEELAYLRTEELSDAQRKENLDAQAKVGALMSLSRKKLLTDRSNDANGSD